MNSTVFKKIIRENRLSSRLVPVFTIAPELELACSRLADFIGDQFIGEREPLVREMLEDGLAAYKCVRKSGEPHIAFMRGLFQRAHLLYARRYVAREGEREHVWSPMFEAITEFEARFKSGATGMVDEACPERITPKTAAFQLAARALNGETFRLYFEDYDVAHDYADRETVGA
ncbi:hypothetical protein [Paraburkholderia tropica]|uniref:hypothetical protein n=1 Tax=Paraburkholderia tropica TaxID=92647 RepID=UPI0007EE0090|nr:hypothetical protein [Paraburkholderia tropica]OBR54000.1 hypothetical protein A6456_21960 [Paraburkholderia tropica]